METASGVVDFQCLARNLHQRIWFHRGRVGQDVPDVGAVIQLRLSTIGLYAKASLHDIAGAVEALPDLDDDPPCLRGESRDRH